MFTTASKLSDPGLVKKIQQTKQVIVDSEAELTRDSPNLSYLQIEERVKDLNRLRNFLRSLQEEARLRKIY